MNNIYNLFKFLEKRDNRKIPLEAKLILDPYSITEDELTVDGNLYFGWSKITELPNTVAVKGKIYKDVLS